MKSLEEKILKEGTCIGNDILKVDNFINHQLDVKFIDEMGVEIAKIFSDLKPNKILTVEASGIAIAMAVSRAMDYLPVVFAKKAKPNTMTGDFYGAEAVSFTKGTSSILRVSKQYLNSNDRIIIVDDFLASGEAGMALCDLVKQAGGEVVGFSAAIEKEYQGGAERLRALGVRVQSLAVIKEMKDGKVYFSENE